MKKYRVKRVYRDNELFRYMLRNRTLEEVQEWCRSPETSSSTCSELTNEVEETNKFGPWFDCYEEEDNLG